MALITLENSQLSAASRLFSASLIRELSRKGRPCQFSRLARQLSPLGLTSSAAPLGNFFDSAFSLLKRKNHRHEYIYKAAIAHKVLLGRHSLRTAVMLNEFRVGTSKADTAILNGTSSVYEIKSERDTLARLEHQVSSYSKVFANVNIITGENHLSNVLAMVPGDVGVLLLSDRFQISTIREAVDSPERTVPGAVFDAIRLYEAKKILRKHMIEIPQVPNTQMHRVLREKFVKLTSLEAHEGMVQVLRGTRSQYPLADFVAALPHSLQTAALYLPLRKRDYATLVDVMALPLGKALEWE